MEDRVSRVESRLRAATSAKSGVRADDGDGIMLGRVLLYAGAVLVALIVLVLQRW